MIVDCQNNNRPDIRKINNIERTFVFCDNIGGCSEIIQRRSEMAKQVMDGKPHKKSGEVTKLT